MTPLRLLAIEDSATVRKLVELSARNQGWSVELAATGAEGVRLATARPPEVLLLDFVLPDMEGLAVCEALARHPTTAAIPTLLLTAKGAELLKRFERFPNVLGHLPKPFTEQQLLERLRAIRPAPAPPATGSAGSARPGGLPESARLLFEVLREGLTQVPAWEAERGDQPAAAYFAQRLLTPAVLRALARRAAARAPGRESGSRSRGSAAPPPQEARPAVLLLDLDDEGFARPLAGLLAALPEPLELVKVTTHPALLGAAARHRPALVLVDPDQLREAEWRSLRDGLAPMTPQARLLGVLGPQRAWRREELLAAGFDAVVVKPVPKNELARLFHSRAAAPRAASQEVR